MNSAPLYRGPWVYCSPGHADHIFKRHSAGFALSSHRQSQRRTCAYKRSVNNIARRDGILLYSLAMKFPNFLLCVHFVFFTRVMEEQILPKYKPTGSYSLLDWLEPNLRNDSFAKLLPHIHINHSTPPRHSRAISGHSSVPHKAPESFRPHSGIY